MEHRSAFIAIVGRPNVGKSTLINALVGSKIAITSHHPNTTRSAIRGIVTSKDLQLVIVDTPGMHKPKTMLGEKLNTLASESMDSVDIVVLCLPANEDIGGGDRYLAQEIFRQRKAKKFLILTKVDSVDKSTVLQKLSQVSELAQTAGFAWDEVVPISAKKGEQISLLLELFKKYALVGPVYFPSEQTSDQSLESMISEYIREAAIADVFQEVPHSIAVVVDNFVERDKKNPTDRPFFDIHATIHVERDSQKSIMIGTNGERLKKVGATARIEIEKLLAGKVFLSLLVKLSPNWQKDPKALRRLGIISE